MQRYVIERAIPDIGSAEREALKGAAAKSNEVLSAVQGEGKGIQGNTATSPATRRCASMWLTTSI